MHNKIILITGATSGIGYELALTCAQHGAIVIALGKNKKKLEKLYTDISEQKLSPPVLLPCNLAGATPDDYYNIAKEISTQFGKLDGLVHNAATLGDKTEIIHYDILKWYETIQVNLNAPFLLTKTLLPLLKLSKNGSIIFTTANQATQGQAYYGAYSVSKAAIKNFAEILSEECESNTNIKVHSINPKQVYSPMHTRNYPASDPDNILKPKDIMSLYINLLTNNLKNIELTNN